MEANNNIYLHTYKIIGHGGEMQSLITGTSPYYQNWAFGEPKFSAPGATCSVLPKGSDEWVTDYCGKNHNRVCMKQVGRQCPSGWVYHSTVKWPKS